MPTASRRRDGSPALRFPPQPIECRSCRTASSARSRGSRPRRRPEWTRATACHRHWPRTARFGPTSRRSKPMPRRSTSRGSNCSWPRSGNSFWRATNCSARGSGCFTREGFPTSRPVEKCWAARARGLLPGLGFCQNRWPTGRAPPTAWAACSVRSSGGRASRSWWPAVSQGDDGLLTAPTRRNEPFVTLSYSINALNTPSSGSL